MDKFWIFFIFFFFYFYIIYVNFYRCSAAPNCVIDSDCAPGYECIPNTCCQNPSKCVKCCSEPEPVCDCSDQQTCTSPMAWGTATDPECSDIWYQPNFIGYPDEEHRGRCYCAAGQIFGSNLEEPICIRGSFPNNYPTESSFIKNFYA